MTTPIGAVLGGPRKVTALLNSPAQTQYLYAVPSMLGCISAAVGALSADTLKTALSITGRGKINWLAVTEGIASGTPTNRIKITLDGVVIFDKSGTSGNGYGMCAIGTAAAQTSGDWMLTLQPITFDASFLVEVSSSSASSVQTLHYHGETNA